jgi:hypothetical protein
MIEATNQPPGRSTAATVDKVPARSSMSINASSQVQPSNGRPSPAPRPGYPVERAGYAAGVGRLEYDLVLAR